MSHIQHNVRTRILVHVGSGVLVSFGIAWLSQHRPHRVVCVVVRCHCRRARWPHRRRRERDGIRIINVIAGVGWWDGRWQSCWCDDMHVVVVGVGVWLWLWMSWYRRGVVTLALAVSCGGGGGGGAGMSCLSLQLTGVWRKGLQLRALSAPPSPRRVVHRVGKALSGGCVSGHKTFTSPSLWYLPMSLLCRVVREVVAQAGVLTADEREADYIINYIQSSMIESTQERVSRPVNSIRLSFRTFD
ncbi:hypothetical protein V8E55_002657 [Tylopilus felleus]